MSQPKNHDICCHCHKPHDMREKIMHETFKLMAEKGIQQVSMREIAQKVGVTKPVLYYYFKNKEDLSYEIFSHGTLTMREMMENINRQNCMLAEAVEKIMQSQLDFFWAHPKVVKMVLHALADSDKKNGISDIFHEIGHRRDEIIRDTVRKAVALTPDCKKFTEDQIDAVCFQVNALTLNFLVASAVEKKNVYTTAMIKQLAKNIAVGAINN